MARKKKEKEVVAEVKGCECDHSSGCCTDEGDCDGECGEGCDCENEPIPSSVTFEFDNMTVQDFINKMVTVARAGGWYVAIPRHSDEDPFEGLVIGTGDYVEKVISGDYAILPEEDEEV